MVVEITTVALIAMIAAHSPLPDATVLQNMILLFVLAIAHTEIALGIERVRWRVADGAHVSLSSVWTFAAAVVLPPASAAVTAVLILAHLWWRSGRPRVMLYRHVFTTATVVLSCLAASAVVQVFGSRAGEDASGFVDLATLTVALLVYTTVNSCLVAGAIAMSSAQPNISTMFGDWDDNVLEIATLCIGCLVAVTLVVNPWLEILIFPPLLVLHRAVLVRRLEQAATTDGKTGLLNAAAWHTQAERELRRAERRRGPRAVLVIDLDHFKAVNDTHGHLAGDDVLAAVADSLRAEVRDQDLVGRFGGEEFVVLLAGLEGPGQGSRELAAVAERIRRRVAALRVEIPTPDGPLTIAGLSVSVGGALYPSDGGDLQGLLQIADAALYTAKRAGRNRVRMGLQLPAQEAPAQRVVDVHGNAT